MIKKLARAVAWCAVAASFAAVATVSTGTAHAAGDDLRLKSSAVLVMDEQTGEVLYGKNTDAVVPIASITKLMTAMVTLDAALDMRELVEISTEEIEITRSSGAKARLPRGTSLSRDDLLHLALMASDNRAAAALASSYPGGVDAFVAAMNAKARLLDMGDSRFADPTGLTPENVSSAEDLAKLVRAANDYPLIREYSTSPSHEVTINGRRVQFGNTNALVRANDWEIGLQKTGFIRAAGRCLVMYAKLATRPVVIVLLDSVGKYTRLVDAARIREWLEPGYSVPTGLVRAEAAKVRTVAKKPVVKVRAPSAAPRARAQFKPAGR
ncbi:MAG: D-alanyl-D-alanine endopeptidase [Burkholderiales bacterium]|jgi:D-alanyl-D-alanine endopeptidase (penicillin-binding protein 7)|nr:D-alanyl-D-alanine endopeptidase [Burkholderiales bacterium]